MTSRRTRRLLAIACLGLAPFVGACADEDGDGATTDEEIQDVQDQTDEAEDRLETELEGQDTGSDANEGEETTTTGG
jgi:hypothetical protein